jgi:hypothetical protein
MKTISVVNLDWDISTSEAMAQFGGRIDRIHEISLLKDGLRDPQIRATGCLGWIWKQWLTAAPKDFIAARVEPFIERCLELRARCKCYDWLPQHDLLVLVCAILASSESQLKTVVETIADTSGDKGEKPVNNGELYAAAWCGMMKHWILGDLEKAGEQSSLIWGAYRDQIICAATKPLVTPWLKRDWNAFLKAQQKDFEKLWGRARKNHWTVRSENEREIVVTTNKLLIEHDWCWAHCGMAMLAYRQFGVEVATDGFWFPPHALKCVSRNSFPA